MLPLGSLGGFQERMICEDDLAEEDGSSGTDGSGQKKKKKLSFF